ncbi:hypothetical protein BpHYR1_047845 [Brachionus plicatilis]|uniref:Uncharacterized protein n=1 Tax=Brachionus plicatilis TaxID=10195 RepID=A0A3M7PIC8_BRAPC|nr:hypothetical protein BpHYR1_047845 [Brachionus plicatilis]
MTNAFTKVALTPSLPVDVFIKSVPAIIATIDAFSPTARIDFMCAFPQASFICFNSSYKTLFFKINTKLNILKKKDGEVSGIFFLISRNFTVCQLWTKNYASNFPEELLCGL